MISWFLKSKFLKRKRSLQNMVYIIGNLMDCFAASFSWADELLTQHLFSNWSLIYTWSVYASKPFVFWFHTYINWTVAMNKYLRQTSCQQILLDQIIIIRVKLKLDQCEQINQRKKKAKSSQAKKSSKRERRRRTAHDIRRDGGETDYSSSCVCVHCSHHHPKWKQTNLFTCLYLCWCLIVIAESNGIELKECSIICWL